MLLVFFRAGHWRTFYYMSEMSTGFLRATFTIVQPRIYVIQSKVSSSVSLMLLFSSQNMGSVISTAQELSLLGCGQLFLYLIPGGDVSTSSGFLSDVQPVRLL